MRRQFPKGKFELSRVGAWAYREPHGRDGPRAGTISAHEARAVFVLFVCLNLKPRLRLFDVLNSNSFVVTLLGIWKWSQDESDILILFLRHNPEIENPSVPIECEVKIVIWITVR